MKTLLLTILFLTSTGLVAQVTKFELKSSPSDVVKQVIVLNGSSLIEEKQKRNEQIKFSAMNLTIITPSQAGFLNRALYLKFDYNKAPKAKACFHKQDCEELTVERKGKKSVINYSPDTQIQIKFYSHPCAKAKSCELYIPAWELNLRQQEKSSLASIPEHIGLIEYDDRLDIVNLDRKEVLFSFSKGIYFNEIGSLKSAQIGSNYRIMMNHEKGAIVVDLINGELFSINHSNIHSTTISDFIASIPSFKTAYQLDQNENRKFIELGSSYIIWEDIVIAFDYDNHIHTWEQHINFNIFDSVITDDQFLLFERTGANLREYSFDLQESRFKPGRLWSGVFSRKHSPFIAGKHLLGLNDDGKRIEMLLPEKTVSTSILKITDFTPSKAGAIFTKIQKGEQCLWQHLRPNDKMSNSYAASGLDLTCSKNMFFNHGLTSASIASHNNDKLTIAIIRVAATVKK